MRTSLFAVLTVTSFFGVTNAPTFAVDHPPLAKAPFSAQQAKAFQQQWAKHIGKELVHTNSVGMQLKLIPPGEYMMGRTEEQFDKIVDIFKKKGREPSRLATWEMLMMPAHRVRITKPFYMGATEVIVEQFRQFCEASGYKTEAERTWQKLGRLADRAGRLIQWVNRVCHWVLEIVHRTSPGFEILPRRWVVERTFAWLGNYRRLSKDYEYRTETSEAMIYVAMMHLMVRRLAPEPKPVRHRNLLQLC